MIARLLAALLASASLATAARAAEPMRLEPFQLVRSLQLVQDRIADGDQASLPMQRKLLEFIDARLKGGADLDDARNFRAVLVYGMSGGNPATVEQVLSSMDPKSADRAVVLGIVNYLRGNPKSTQTSLASVDPMQQPSDLGAFVALIKGSTLASEDPDGALKLFDQARLLGTGSLVEEAALRRSIELAGKLGDVDRFLRGCTQYATRFLHSPYASQFADALVAGVVAQTKAINRERLTAIGALMDPEREKVMYLRIARGAAIAGDRDFSAFAAARAEEAEAKAGHADPRADLYASLSSIASDKVEDTRSKLKAIDRAGLSPGDQGLLDAATAVVAGIVTPPAHESVATPVEAEVLAPPAGSPESDAPSLARAAPAPRDAKPDAAEIYIAEGRKKIAAIDELLGEARQ